MVSDMRIGLGLGLAVVVVSAACSTPSYGPRSIAGPSGSKVDVPAGALKTPADLALVAVTTGFPGLPSKAGPTVFALTPHGQTFDVPVTITIPATVAQTQLLTAQPGGQWAAVPGARRVGASLVAEVSHFSFFVPAGAVTVRAIIGDGWAVREIDPADGGVRTLVDGLPEGNYVTSVAVDDQGRVYWLDNVTDAIARVDSDGANRQVLYNAPDPSLNPQGLALDVAHGVMFWVQGNNVMKAQLDGSGAAPFIVGTANDYPTAVALDAAGGVVFWADNGSDTVNRINSDGSGRQVLHHASDPYANPSALSVDVTAGLLFWGEGWDLVSAPLSGGALTTVVAGVMEKNTVTGTAVDPAARQVYWTDNGTDALSRSSYDGSGQERLYRSTPYLPTGLPDGGPDGPNFTNPQGVALTR